MADITFDVKGWPKKDAVLSAVDALGGWAPDGGSGSTFKMKNDVFGVKAQVDLKRGLGKTVVRVRTWGGAGSWWLEQAGGKFRKTIEGVADPVPASSTFVTPALGTEDDPLDLSGWQDDLLSNSYDPDPWDFDQIVTPVASTGTSPLPADSIQSIEQTLAASPIKGRWMPIGGPGGQGTHSFTKPPNNWQSDNAIDMKVAQGTPVRAIADGVISTSYGYGEMASSGRFEGSRLHLQLPNGDVAFYAHLSKLVAKPGETVKEGQVIGHSGSANGVPHLHFATKKSDPVAWAEKGRAR